MDLSRAARRCLAITVAAALLASALVACTPAVSPRSGRVLQPGGFAAELRVTPAAFTTGQVELTTRLGDATTVDGNTTASLQIPWLALGGFWFWFEYTFRLGLFAPCEVGLDYGALQLGGELRCAVLDDRRGDPISLALGLGGTWLPAHREQGWVARLGADAGLALSPAWQLVGGLWGQFGARGHTLRLDTDDIDEKFLNEDGDFLAIPSHAALERLELRVAGHVGFTVEDDAGEVGGTFAIVGWVIPWADDPLSALCDGCDALDVTDLVEHWGVTLSATFTATLVPRTHESLDELERLYPAPPGRHYERRLDDELATGGWIMLGLSYGLGVVPAIMFAGMDLENDSEMAIAISSWFVPIAGPIIWRQYIETDSALENAFVDAVGYGTSVLQLTAGLLLWQAWVHGDHHLVDDEMGIFLVMPTPTPEGFGVSTAGRF